MAINIKDKNSNKNNINNYTETKLFWGCFVSVDRSVSTQILKRWRQTQNEDNLKNKDNLKNEDNIKSEDDFKIEDALKN